MLNPRLFLLSLLAGAFALGSFAACGDDDGDGDEPTATRTATAGTPDASATSTSAATTTATTPAGQSATPTATATATPGDDQIPFETPSTIFSKDGSGLEQAILADVRVGRNATWDRVVIEFEGDQVPGYEVAYVEAISQCGSGQPLEFESPVVVSVTVRPAAGHTEAGEATVPTEVTPTGTASVQEVLGFCDFEGVVGYGIGLSGARPFRVFELDGPPRLVIDFSG